MVSADLTEGAAVGYKWFDRERLRPLFPFGFGLSYTHFTYGKPKVRAGGDGWTARVRVTNSGQRAGQEVVQVYVRPPEGALERLAAFDKIELAPGAAKTVALNIDLKMIAQWNERRRCWYVPAGDYRVMFGKDAETAITGSTVHVRKAIACLKDR